MVSCNKHLKQEGGWLLVLTMDSKRGQLRVEIEDLKCRPMSRVVGDSTLGYTKLGSERSYNLCGKRDQRRRENQSPKEKPKVTMSNSDRNTNIYFFIICSWDWHLLYSPFCSVYSGGVFVEWQVSWLYLLYSSFSSYCTRQPARIQWGQTISW